MRITIIGAGALGTLFGALLAEVAEVSLLDRSPEVVSAIRRDGLRVSEPGARGVPATDWPIAARARAWAAPTPMAETGAPGDRGQRTVSWLRHYAELVPWATRENDREDEPAPEPKRLARVAATTDPAAAGDADLALVLVKSSGTRWAAEAAARVLAPDGLALTLQNGLGNREILERRLGQERVWQGVTAQGATLLGPGRARHAGCGPTHLETRPAIASRAQEVAALFRRAGFETHLSPDLAGLIWGKLVVNAGINALTAILRVPNGALAEAPAARALMLSAAAEAAQVARARGIALPYESPEDKVLEVCRATAENRSSMLQDALRGRPTEVDAINGAVVREARSLGLAAPVNEMLANLVKAMEQTQPVRIRPFEEAK